MSKIYFYEKNYYIYYIYFIYFSQYYLCSKNDLNIYYTNSSSFGIAQFNTIGARFSTIIINNLKFSLGFEYQKNLQDLKFTDIENTSNDYLVHSYIDNYHLTTNNFDFLLNYKLLELK